MKIIDAQELIDLPDGSVFTYRERPYSHGLFKKEKLENPDSPGLFRYRWYIQREMVGVMSFNESTVELSNSLRICRILDLTKKYLVFEPKDIDSVIHFFTQP